MLLHITPINSLVHLLDQDGIIYLVCYCPLWGDTDSPRGCYAIDVVRPLVTRALVRPMLQALEGWLVTRTCGGGFTEDRICDTNEGQVIRTPSISM